MDTPVLYHSFHDNHCRTPGVILKQVNGTSILTVLLLGSNCWI